MGRGSAILTRRRWTTDDDTTLRQLYPAHTAQQIAAELERSVSSINARARNLGLRKPDGYAAEVARRRWREGRNEGSRSSCFRPGDAPWNKGVPGSAGYHPNSRKHHFRPGHLDGQAAHNYRPIGSLRVTKDGSLERKVTDDPSICPARRWIAVARLVWEAAHGPVPKKHVVRFLDGHHTTDESAITPDKLECISMAENMRRNTYHRYPQPIPQLIQLRGALTRKINNREKQNEKRD